ncbi:MAG TPA: 30S ribosomal protein S18 [Thermoanaerobaculia bacterium]|nr:30S ribosomal protein S18 [Thermoanaerobaculia bacterium]
MEAVGQGRGAPEGEGGAPSSAPRGATGFRGGKRGDPGGKERVMAPMPQRGGSRDREGKTAGRKKFFVRRRKVCKFCAEKLEYVDWKDVKLLQSFIPERGKILPRRISGTCALHQRKLQTAIKRARSIALIPYVTD